MTLLEMNCGFDELELTTASSSSREPIAAG
jgi:hypothetical protein